MERDKHIGLELRVLSNIFKKKLDCKISSRVNGITGLQGKILLYLAEHVKEDVYQRDLEHELKVKRSTISEMLQPLEKNGYLLKVSVGDDARLKKLILTQKAFETRDKICEVIEEFEQNINMSLNDDEYVEFFRLIDKIHHNLTKC